MAAVGVALWLWLCGLGRLGEGGRRRAAHSTAAMLILTLTQTKTQNRGEIATRIMRAGTELGINTLGIFSHEDRFTQHRYARICVCVYVCICVWKRGPPHRSGRRFYY